LAFDRALSGDLPQISTDDVLAAISLTRPSVSPDAAQRFEVEAGVYSRL
jgi:hypothetical protein